MLPIFAYLCCLASVSSHETQLESNLKWFFNKLEQDGGFRNFLIGSSEMDELSQSLNYLGHPLMDWLVLFDPENWPESKNFGVMLDSSKKTCQRSKSESGIRRHVVFPINSSLPYSELTVQCLDVELKSFSPFHRLLVVSSDFQQSQLLKKSRRNMEKTNSLTPNKWAIQPSLTRSKWNMDEIWGLSVPHHLKLLESGLKSQILKPTFLS